MTSKGCTVLESTESRICHVCRKDIANGELSHLYYHDGRCCLAGAEVDVCGGCHRERRKAAA